MNIAMIASVQTILRLGSIREAARLEGRPPASMSSALARIEEAMAVPLVRRVGGRLMLTLEAEHRLEAIERMAEASRLLTGLAQPGTAGPVVPVSLLSLQRLVEVARSGSIRRAARNLQIGQPQLTRQISELERQLGLDLFRRSESGVSCTQAGLAALALAEQIVQDWEQATAASAQRFRDRILTWRIGTIFPLGHESSIAHMLAEVLARWAELRFRQQLSISSATAEDLLAGLKLHDYDMLLIDQRNTSPDCEATIVASDALWLVGPPGMDESRPIPEVLAAGTLVLPSRRSGIRQAADRFFRPGPGRANPRPGKLIEVDSVPVIVNLVACQGFLGVLPRSAVERLPFPLSRWPLPDECRQELSLVWHRDSLPKPATEAFLALLRSAVTRHRNDLPDGIACPETGIPPQG